MFPWIKIGRHKSKWHSCHLHHTHWGAYAYELRYKEKINRDVVVLSRFAHYEVMHNLLCGGRKRVRQQKVFPNQFQEMANQWCYLPRFLKLGLILAISVIVLRLLWL